MFCFNISTLSIQERANISHRKYIIHMYTYIRVTKYRKKRNKYLIDTKFKMMPLHKIM